MHTETGTRPTEETPDGSVNHCAHCDSVFTHRVERGDTFTWYALPIFWCQSCCQFSVQDTNDLITGIRPLAAMDIKALGGNGRMKLFMLLLQLLVNEINRKRIRT